jgi:4-carboxymuconolactone decarboxylase
LGCPENVETVMNGLPTLFTDTREQVVYKIATTLANSRSVPEGLYDRRSKRSAM